MAYYEVRNVNGGGLIGYFHARQPSMAIKFATDEVKRLGYKVLPMVAKKVDA
jgi:hypothetical protein